MTITLPPTRPGRAKRGRAAVPSNGRLSLRAISPEDLDDLAERLDGTPVPGVRMSEEDFVNWALYRVDAEWVDGEVILMAPGNEDHETIDEWLGRLLGEFVERRDLGKFLRNMFVRFAKKRSRRVPDLMFISEARRHRIKPTYVDGAPDLIVEIISPDSRNRDRRDKYVEYQAAGVREYWIIDPVLRRVDAYALRGRKYDAIVPRGDRFTSTVLSGFYLRTDWLFGPRRPKVSQVLPELGVRN